MSTVEERHHPSASTSSATTRPSPASTAGRRPASRTRSSACGSSSGSECLLFGGLISTYLLYKNTAVQGPTPRDLYDIPFTSVSSFVLLMSSMTMVLALAALQRGDHHRCRAWLVTTALLGATFISGQVYEFTSFVKEGMGYTTNTASSSFYTLTGFHGVHVCIGILMLMSLFVMSLAWALATSEVRGARDHRALRGRRRRAPRPARPLRRGLGQFADPDADFDKLIAEQAKLQDKIDAANAWELDATLEIAMDALRLPPGDADVTKLSGGERRRVALCRLLLSKPDMLLLDEPTNHLDAESVAWLERFLQEYPGTVVAVTHDRYFLDNVAGWILELDRGAGHPVGGQLLVVARAEAGAARRRGEAGVGAPARRSSASSSGSGWRPRRARPRPRRASPRYEELLAEDETDNGSTGVEIYIPPGPRLGDVVVEAEHLRKGYGDTLLIDDLTFTLPPRRHRRRHRPERRRQDDAVPHDHRPGEARRRRRSRVGDTVELAYVDQSRDALDADKHRLGGDHRRARHDRARQARDRTRAPTSRWFNFKGADQQKQVGELSGGERNRVHLAKLLRSGGNVLLLDEPTNDLDVDTLRALEEALDRLRRLRRRDQPRSLVPRPHRHPHPRLRGRLAGALVRGQLQRVRGDWVTETKRRRRRPAPPHQVQAARPVVTRRRRNALFLAGYAAVAFAYFGVRLVSTSRARPARARARPADLRLVVRVVAPRARDVAEPVLQPCDLRARRGEPRLGDDRPGARASCSLPSPHFRSRRPFNVAELLVPAVSAFTAYLLCRHLTRSLWASLVGGYLFGFSSYMLGQEQGTCT